MSSGCLRDALQSLQRRSLIETTKGGFILQTIVLDYVTQKFVEQVCTELQSGEPNLLNSHALLKAQSKDYVRQIQTRLILEPVASYLQALFRSGTVLEEHLSSLLDKLRKDATLAGLYGWKHLQPA